MALRGQLFASPRQPFRIRMKGFVFGEQEGFAGEVGEFLFAVGAARVDDLGYVPAVIRAGGNEVPIHRPVVVLAEGETVGWVVVAGFRERDEVGGINEGNFVGDGETNAETAGGALMVVNLNDLTAEGRGATIFGLIFRDE